MRLFLVMFVAFASTAAAAEDVAGKIDWKPVLDARQTITIRGVRYVPEFALRDWSIRRATNGDSEFTRFEVRPGDQWSEDASSGENKERSELDGYKNTWKSGADVWAAYSFMIEPGPRYRSDWSSIGQMHAAGIDVKPISIHFNDERLVINSDAFNGGRSTVSLRYNGPLTRKDWHHVVFHMKQSTGGDGRLEFWLDGNKIINYSGPIGSDANYYWKFGIYRGYGPIPAPLAIQYANMEIGTTDLSGRIGSPLAVR
jgi:hypothetical protein